MRPASCTPPTADSIHDPLPMKRPLPLPAHRSVWRGAIAVLLSLLAACGATPTRLATTPEQAAALLARGEYAAAARDYAALAEATPGAVGNEYRLSALGAALRASDTALATRQLGLFTPPVEPATAYRRDLLATELQWLTAGAPAAWETLSALQAPQTAAQIEAYHELRQRLALAAQRPLQAIRSMAERETLRASDAPALATLRAEFLLQLREAIARGLTTDPRSAGRDAAARGWLEAAPLAARAALAPQSANAALTAAWRARYPRHPASAALAATHKPIAPPDTAATPGAASAASATASASASKPATSTTQPAAAQPTVVRPEAHVAALLPLSGRNAAAGAQLRDGLLSAYYATPVAARAPLRFYDTGALSVAEALQSATSAGAEFVIGPLAREEVVSAATFQTQVPILGLNFLPADQAASSSTFYQFALSPEEEARAVARRALSEGRRRAIAFVPAGEWGARVLKAFKEELEAGGGRVLTAETLSGSDLTATLQTALRLDDSRARHRRLQAVLDLPLAFQPRRRSDVDFLFTPGQAALLRQLRPQLQFNAAGDIPTYTTSEAWDGRSGNDLDGVMFPDMPWMIAADTPAVAALRAATSSAFGDTRGRGRLYAFGHDAWLLQQALRERGKAMGASGLTIDGASGTLSLDAERRVQRSLRWAEITSDSLKLLDDGA
ncbi:MAG: penicillin-binding protein activator [Sinobacteraceae bacterium]|nr:penicillin-binding protein activator [Nevskiaceae bacterium]